MPEQRTKGTVEIFCSYSHCDSGLLRDFEAHTAILRRTDGVIVWTDRQIAPGTYWHQQIDSRLNSADVIVLLVSADFINSDYCYKRELARALERHAAQEADVVPVILRPCLWQKAPFGQLQAMPPEGKAVTEWPNQDRAWTEVAIGLENIVTAAMQKQFVRSVMTRMARWELLQATQKRIFEIQADVAAKQRTVQKAARTWDDYVREACRGF